MSNDLLIDKRIIERNIKKGRLDATEYRRMLEALPDLKGQVWHRPEARATEAAPAVASAPASVAPPPPAAPAAYAPSEPADAEHEAPLPSPNQPSPFG